MFASLLKRLDDVSLDFREYQKIKSRIGYAKNKIKGAITRGSVIRSVVGTLGDMTSTIIGVSLYGPEIEGNPEALSYMKRYGVVEGLLLHNIKGLIPFYGITLGLYGGYKLYSLKLKGDNKELFDKSAYMISDLCLDIFGALRWTAIGYNIGNLISMNLPEPYSMMAYITTFSASFAPMAYSLGKSYKKKLADIKTLSKALLHKS
jgi:hypothetical protein